MAAVLGMRGTGGWASGQRPTNFREGLLYLYPNSPAILTMIMGKLKSESVNDPQFTIFSKGLPQMRAMLDDSLTSGDGSADTVVLPLETSADESCFRAGQVLINERTQEVLWVSSVTDDDSGEITVATRGSVGTAATAMLNNDYVLIVGNRNEEGAAVPTSISFNASTTVNYTQIFRTPLILTGTAKETYMRTGDIEKELKREAVERHAIEMEWAWIFGASHEATGSNGHGERTTGGLLEYVTSNVYDAAGTLTKAGWEGFLEDVFSVPGGESEKLLVCGNKALTALNAMAQAYGHISLTPTSDTFGLKLMQYETPYGTLQMKGHPLLSQNPGFADWGIVIDPRNLRYRPLKNRDTKFLKDRGSNGADASTHEFLTEAGLEVRHENTHGILKNAATFEP